MSENRIPEQILETIRRTDNFVLLTHEQPDGDALGSLLGMAEILEDMGKRTFAYMDEPVSHLYNFLPHCSRISCSFEKLGRFVRESGPDIAALAMDCGEADRLGKRCHELLRIKPFIVIDHHLSHHDYGNLRWVDPARSSAGEMVYEIGEALGFRPNPDCAFDLYVAIATDTGSFKYENTGPRTFEIAAQLVACGVRPEQVSNLVYDNFSYARLKLMELVLGTLTLCEHEQIAFIHVTREMFDRSGALRQDVEGFIDLPRSLHSVRVAVFLKETQSDTISVSLRAKGDCDVAGIAKLFGGGGHRNAAGCRFPGESFEDVREKIRKALQKELSSIS